MTRIRRAEQTDLSLLAAAERACFSEAEAATEEQIKERLACFPDHFWLLFEEEELVSFIDGMATDELDLTDEMYEKASMHQQDGAWQMLFGVGTLPSRQHQGFAGRLMKQVIRDTKAQGRKGIVLTCKDKLIPFYEQFGFVKEGKSESAHGGAVWYQMRLKL